MASARQPQLPASFYSDRNCHGGGRQEYSRNLYLQRLRPHAGRQPGGYGVRARQPGDRIRPHPPSLVADVGKRVREQQRLCLDDAGGHDHAGGDGGAGGAREPPPWAEAARGGESRDLHGAARPAPGGVRVASVQHLARERHLRRRLVRGQRQDCRSGHRRHLWRRPAGVVPALVLSARAPKA